MTSDTVTLANWLQPPHNRWSFQHVRELIPTAAIWRGAGPVWDLAPEPAALGELAIAAGPLGRLRFDALLEDTYTDAIAVLHDGRMVFEDYRNGMRPATPHLVMSVSKSITSTATGVLVGSGSLTPDRLVTDVLPELAGTSFDGATLRHLLDMRTGTWQDIRTDEQSMQFLERCLWQPPSRRDVSTDLTEYYATMRNDRPHGGAFEYRSILTNVLSLVTERAAGQRYADLVSSTLWQRLGAERDAEITVDGHGNAVADIGVCATLRDLLRFGELLRCGGRRGDEQIVPAEWVRDILTPDPDSVDAFGEHGRLYLPGAHSYYRNQWWVLRPRSLGGVFMALGIHGQLVLVHEAARAVVVKLSTWPDSWDDVRAQATIGGCVDLVEQLARR